MKFLPEGVGPGTASVMPEDFGFWQRGAIGAETKRINRKGNRNRMTFTYGPFTPELGQIFVTRLRAAQQDKLRVPFPLLISQGSPGSPVVDGAGQQGTTLVLRGLTRGVVIRTGFWLSIEDESGQHYLHNVETGAAADANGEASITLIEQLRHPFLDGAKVNLAKPMIEGFVGGDAGQWSTSADRVLPISFTLEEAK